jgi:hypothetical protein
LQLSPEHEETEAVPDLHGVCVLLAEDNEINQLIAMELLEDVGVVLDVVENGSLAVNKVLNATKHYDIVLMDVQMPVMDGIEATRKIREHTQTLPIIAMTAHVMEEERQRCYQAGMNDHISKPIDPKQLYEVVEKWAKKNPKPLAPPLELAPPPPPSDEFPEQLLPFDLPAALKRVNNKKTLLRKVLVDFHTKYEGFMLQIHEAIAQQNSDAARLAHTLKGIAATLGAKELSEAAGAVESALFSGQLAELEQLLKTLDMTLKPALAAAATLKTS